MITISEADMEQKMNEIKDNMRRIKEGINDDRDPIFIELLGTYDPRTNPAKVTIKEEEVLKWLNNGAQPSDTVKNLLSKEGIIKKFADSKSGK